MFLRFDNITHHYAESGTVLKIPHLEIEKGSFVALIGPSGCGKSTLLRLVAGLETPGKGTLTFGNGSANKGPLRTGIVFQEATLLPWLRVEDNIALPLRIRGTKAGPRREAAREEAARVGLEQAVHLYPDQLSGGMKMRTALARALVEAPELLLLDEPFSALDEITRDRLNEDLSALHAARTRTTLLVTHSVTEAAFLADRILVLKTAPGEIVADIAHPRPHPRDPETRNEEGFHQLTAGLSRLLREHAGE